MLQLYPSNKTESLAYLIAEIIDRHPLKTIFSEDLILIQSQGMGTWLQQEISSHTGVSALLQCQMPASFVWKLAEQLMPNERHIPIFEKTNLRWEIFRRLPEKLDDPKYALLKTYLNSQAENNKGYDQSSIQQKTLFDLSVVIADVFDAYQNYRSDWIEAWESGESGVVNATIGSNQAGLKELEQWQSDLWCSLYPDIALTERRHRSRLFAKLIDILRTPNGAIKAQLPERLFIFGLSALPPQWLPVMSALSQHVDIHFLIHNPCQYYWGDVVSPVQQLKLEKALVDKGVSLETAADTFLEGNPLLASWGKLGRDYLSLLSDFSGIKEAQVSLFDDVFPLTALQSIQNDIQQLQTTQFEMRETDDSIRFASCHSHLREVEALHDYLFNVLNQYPDIKPKDIIVMMPDVQDFASLIDAVFSRAAYDIHGQANYLPYGISDQLLSMDQPLVDTLSELLNLTSSRISGADCLDWLEMPAIRSRFSITETDMEDIKEWIKQLNIRWGLSEQHRDSLLGMKGSGGNNTWLSASQRLLAGYIYGEEAIYGHGETELLAFPQRSPEKQILAGKLMRFLDTVESTIELQSKQLKLDVWLTELSNLWQSWLDFELVSTDIHTLLNSFNDDITKEATQTQFDLPISFTVISSLLKGLFDNQRVSQRFLAGRINFCTLMPMRSIPFKVVCMLGLNEGAYPRPIQGQSFDLLTHTPSRVGDRSRREDDRFLFLEALCSARSHLYISYCGRDIQDNSERYPSILVSELQNYCIEYVTLENKTFEGDESILDVCLVEHHLQPFHKDYYFQDSSNDQDQLIHLTPSTLDKTFSTEWLPLVNTEAEQPKRLPALTTSLSAEEREALDIIKVEDDEQFDLFSAAPKIEKTHIDFDRLTECLSQPLPFYYRTSLQVNLYKLDEEMPVSEPFSIQGLDAYELKKELVQSWFQGPSEDKNSAFLTKKWQLEGKLPRAPLDTYYLDTIQTSVKPMYDYICQRVSGESVHHEFEIDLDDYQVKGSFISHGDQLIDMALSKRFGSHFFSFWVRHVYWSLYCVRTNKEGHKASRLVGPENEICVPLLSADKAEVFAKECCEFFELATRNAKPFFPKSTYALLFESEAKAKGAFFGNQHIPGESGDSYWQRYCALNADSVDPLALPDFASSLLFQQVENIKDLIEIRKIQVPAQDDALNIAKSGGRS